MSPFREGSLLDPLRSGGGSVGALIRARDWSKTPIGPMATWPIAFQTLLRSMLNSQQPMAVYWGPELLHFYNDAYLPILGKKHPAALGQRVRETWAEAWSLIWPDIEKVITGGHAVLHEDGHVPIARDGVLQDAWWNYSFSPAYDDAGVIAGTLLIGTETTAEVHGRALLERATCAAERARQELQDIFMQAPLPMAILSGPEHRFTLANAPYEQLVGRKVVGKPLGEAFSEDEVGYYVPLLDRVYQTGEPVVLHEALLELVDTHGATTTRFIDVGYHPHRDVDGALAGVLAVVYDVTGQVAARKQLEHARDTAQSANRAKDEFLATVSHELRTPLMAMLGWATMLRDTQDPRRLERGLEVIERNANAQSKLIEDILDVSRIISGKLRLSVGRVALATVITAAVETIRLAAAAKQIRVELTVADVDLIGDVDRIQQIVWNLLSNAIKFTPKTGVVSVRAFQEGSLAHIEVHDTGQGISATFLPYMFDRFRQDDASTTKQQAGLGLGLSIVRHLTELHGGTVSARSEGEGRGAMFEVVLPIRAVAPVAGPDASPGNPPPAAATVIAGRLQGAHILVVDDQDDARELVATVLEDAGARVTQARSASDAIEALAATDITAIISDVGMPFEDGYSLIQRVRATAARALPALALTAFARVEDRDRALAAGFDEHLAKPIEPARLVTAVARLIRR